MGHIYKRGNIYWIKYSKNGKPYYETTKSKKEADAKRLLRKREGEISEGKIPGVYFEKVRFDELAEDFITDYRLNQRKSLVRAERSITLLKRFFEGMRVPSITSPKIASYIEERIAEGAANATINRELSALKRALNLGARQTPPKVDRVPHIPMLKENNARKGFFEHGDFIALRKALPPHLKPFITFAYKTGWRLSEISSLTWDQVDMNQGIVRLEVGETKNNEGRTVFLDQELKGLIQRQMEKRGKSKTILPYVFLKSNGSDRVKSFDKAWRTACKQAKIGKRLFHDFRRTAIRNMVRSGIPERVAMMISGHKTRTVFDRYNIVSDTDLKLAAQRQETYLESQKVTKTVTIHDFPTNKELASAA